MQVNWRRPLYTKHKNVIGLKIAGIQLLWYLPVWTYFVIIFCLRRACCVFSSSHIQSWSWYRRDLLPSAHHIDMLYNGYWPISLRHIAKKWNFPFVIFHSMFMFRAVFLFINVTDGYARAILKMCVLCICQMNIY